MNLKQPPRHFSDSAFGICIAASALFAIQLTALGASAPDPSALGMTESLAKVCGPVDAGVAANLQQKATQMAQGVKEEELAQLRNSAEYQAAYQSIADSLGNSEKDAKAACTSAPAPKQ